MPFFYGAGSSKNLFSHYPYHDVCLFISHTANQPHVAMPMVAHRDISDRFKQNPEPSLLVRPTNHSRQTTICKWRQLITLSANLYQQMNLRENRQCHHAGNIISHWNGTWHSLIWPCYKGKVCRFPSTIHYHSSSIFSSRQKTKKDMGPFFYQSLANK